jgi:hypothetical protein
VGDLVRIRVVRCRPAYYDDLGVYDADTLYVVSDDGPDPAEVVVDVPVERDAAFMTLARCEDRRARLRLRR